MDGRGSGRRLIGRRRSLPLIRQRGDLPFELVKAFLQCGLFLANALKGLIVLRFHHESVESSNQNT